MTGTVEPENGQKKEMVEHSTTVLLDCLALNVTRASMEWANVALCHRFIHQVADKYHSEHISVLGQSDFAGRVIRHINYLPHFFYIFDLLITQQGAVLLQEGTSCIVFAMPCICSRVDLCHIESQFKLIFISCAYGIEI